MLQFKFPGTHDEVIVNSTFLMIIEPIPVMSSTFSIRCGILEEFPFIHKLSESVFALADIAWCPG